MTAVIDVKELLPLYALGALDADEAAIVERAIARDPSLAAELESCRDTIGDLGRLIAPIEPGPEVLNRLMASVGAGRFEKLSSRMASLFDVTVERAREILGLIERPASWELAAPGIGLVHFDGGAPFAAADCGFVRIDPGATFPLHTHRGEEVSLILSGRLRDADGRILAPGEELVHSEGSAHHLTADGDEPCVFAARAMNGIEIAGMPVVPPGKTR